MVRWAPILAAAFAAGCNQGFDGSDADGGDGAGGGLFGSSTGSNERGDGSWDSTTGSSSAQGSDQAAAGTGTTGGVGPTDGTLCAGPPAEGYYTSVARITVDDSSSLATPALVRELTDFADWDVEAPLPVRPHEFLNAYAAPIEDGLFAEVIVPDDATRPDRLHVGVDARVDPATDYRGRNLVQLAVTFASTNAANVATPDVTFVLDTSRSMAGEGLARLQGVVKGAIDPITSGSRSVAAFTTQGQGTRIRAMGPWLSATEGDALLEATNDLSDEVDFDATLLSALDEARTQAFAVDKPGVVMVVTDGNYALSAEARERVKNERAAWPPVRVVGVGVGPALAYVDDLLDDLTDASGGAYLYAPSKEIAESELSANFGRLTQIAARNVRLRLDLPASMELVALAGGAGAQGEDLAEGQNLAADSTMVFHAYLLASSGDDCRQVGVSLEWDDADEASAHHTFPAEGHVDVGLWQRADPSFGPGEGFRRIEAIAMTANALRGPEVDRLAAAGAALGQFLRDVPGDRAGELCGALERLGGAAIEGCTGP